MKEIDSTKRSALSSKKAARFSLPFLEHRDTKKPSFKHLSHKNDYEKSFPQEFYAFKKQMKFTEIVNENKRKIKASFTTEEKLKMFRGILLTRMVDNELKQMFSRGKICYQNTPFAGKGFRSLGQEAIYALPLRLKNFFDADKKYQGDVIAPMIRDLGAVLAMSQDDIESALNAQAGKSGSPLNGVDLHLGHDEKGIITPSAPLAISVSTLVGMAHAFKLRKQNRVAISLIGEGATSLGEWHEAINLAAVKELPIIFCIQNNQQALSTPVFQQSKLSSFAHKGWGYGMNFLSIDGNDPEDIASTFAFLRTLAINKQPTLVELVTMRMCGHAHHDDMLYLGHEPKTSLEIPDIKTAGYGQKKLYEKFKLLDPLKIYENKLSHDGVLSSQIVKEYQEEISEKINSALKNIQKRPWPKKLPTIFHAPVIFPKKDSDSVNQAFSSKGVNYLQAIGKAIKEVMTEQENVLVIGEDVAPPYGNVFMMFKEVMQLFKHRFINTPISESGILGCMAGLCREGFIPIGEMQFNDFVACGMNQLVNNIAKTYFRTGINLPLVLRMPYGGLRRAGPFHSQDTSTWFLSTPGLKIFAPSTPNDAYHMMKIAIKDPDPVLFYEHIFLYRASFIKQNLVTNSPFYLGANLLKKGHNLTIISYGAFVHKALTAAKAIEKTTHYTVEVVDLRVLSPVDFSLCFDSVKKTSRVLLVGEANKTGGILESVASQLSEKMFRYLDAPVTVLGSKETPVPYSPSLEDLYLLNEEDIVKEAIRLLEF